MAGVFKAYDIRGIYGETITEDLVEKIGKAFVTFVKCKTVVIGRDMRPHSAPLFDALTRGLTALGANIIDIGLCSTPMCYHACGKLNADASIMITASHNSAEWNGMKFTREQAIPISGATGIADLERIVNEESYDALATTPGTISSYDIMPEYTELVASCADLSKPINIVADMGNAVGSIEAKTIDNLVSMDKMFEELDGTFPNHEANPLNTATLADLQANVKAGDYDFGVSFDGDADRAGFVDENGEIIPMDIISALIAEDLLSHEKGVIFYDLRSSWSVKEVIEENGGTPMMSRVGHAFIKQQMRDNNAIFAGELSGHYYFRTNFFTESSAMAVLCVANIVSKSDKKLSELIAPIQRYFASGEINSEVADTDTVLDMIRNDYGTDGRMFELDGVSVEYSDWWLNVRSSNTEPLIRLNVEAKTKEVMEAKRDELLAKIRG
ncbi:MAG: phosphomannomutase/phosphoglucomutase [Kiritimatiellae bacterium]|nr:phosphomannomutase/phosphoglucomutase [Kiritimatiellia bacterium]